MSTIELPDDVAAALAAAAAERGVTEAELIAEFVGSDRPKLDGLEGFLRRCCSLTPTSGSPLQIAAPNGTERAYR